MSFFIPGRTTCAICGRAIDHRWQAARLPFVDPSQAPELATLARGYVHRDCWETWDQRERYSAAAAALVARNRDSSDPLTPVVEGDGLITLDVPPTKIFRLDDLQALVTLDIPWADTCRVASWFGDAASGTVVGELSLGGETWGLRQTDGGSEFVRSQAGEPIEIVGARLDRLRRWATVLRTRCDRLGKVSS